MQVNIKNIQLKSMKFIFNYIKINIIKILTNKTQIQQNLHSFFN